MDQSLHSTKARLPDSNQKANALEVLLPDLSAACFIKSGPVFIASLKMFDNSSEISSRFL